MRRLIQTSIKRPVAVMMLVIVVLLLGTISLRDLKVDLFPEIDLPVAVVATTYEGAAPQEVENLVTDPIESQLRTIEGIDTIQSVSQNSASLVIMLFDYGISIDSILNDVREKVDQVADFLPENVNKPTVMRLDPQATPVVYLGLSGAPIDELQDVATQSIQPDIEQANGVASATIIGGIEREIRIELDQARMEQFGLTGGQIVQTLQAENRSVSAGSVERGTQDVSVRIDGEFTSIDEIEDTQLQLQDGQVVKIKDVATVEDTLKDRDSNASVNGDDALAFSVMKQSDANTVEVADAVKREIEKINENYADRGIEVNVIVDTSDYITESMDTVTSNMLVGGILATLILLVFLRSIRTTLVIAFSMPIAVISTFTLMYFTGETLNVLSMGGLALGIGMMVDSSIVILENIFKKRELGMPIHEAALEGGHELSGAVLASTLTTVVVFLPMILIEGLTAQLFRPLSIAVIFALSMSLLTALTLVPMLSSKMLSRVKLTFDGEATGGFINRILNRVQDFYGFILEKALRLRKTVAIIVSLIVIGSLALIPFLGFELMPDEDSGQISIMLTTKSGSTLEATGEKVTEVTERLQELEDEIDMTFINTGGDATGVGGGGTGEASIMIELVDSANRTITTQQFVNQASELLADIPGAEIIVQESSQGMMSTGSPIQIEITGDNLDVLDDLSQQVIWMVEEIDGTMNIEASTDEGSPQLEVDVNREVASGYGLSYQQVMTELNLAFNGETATFFKEEGNEYDVTVTLPKDKTQTIRDLETMVIRNNEGVDVPLQAVAELRQIEGPTAINRTDQLRTVNVTSDISGRDLGSVTTEIDQALKGVTLPDGYNIHMGGQSEQMDEAFGQLLLALALGIFLVYSVMAIQFESFTYPFIIMFSMPTMIVGVILGLLVTGISLSTVAMIGLIILAGIVVNNGIILVDYINQLRERGWDRTEAIIESGKSRLRPILMTTLTTALAMVPMAIGIGEGSETQQPMAVTVVFGLMTSTLFTLLYVPVMYIIIDNVTNSFKGLFKRKIS